MPDRRSFLKTTLSTGALSLWGSRASAERAGLQAVLDQHGKDTIANVELYKVPSIRGMQGGGFLWVRLETKGGVVGFGECYPVKDSVRWIQQYLEAAKGQRVADLVENFYRKALEDYDHSRETYAKVAWGGGVACLEIALWDILGKMAAQPIHQLLGKKHHDAIPLYANHGVFPGKGPSQLERILKLKEEGFPMFKWDPFKGSPEDEKTIAQQMHLVEQVREAAGPEFKIAIDAHRRWKNLTGPKIAAKIMEKLDIIFFEEPVHHAKVAMFQELAAFTSVPLATGELMTHRDEVSAICASDSLTYLQLDVGNFGGIRPTWEAYQLAGTHNVKIATHNWAGPLTTLATLQVVATMPNLFVQEWPHTTYGQDWEREIVQPALKPQKGFIQVPDGPGLGAEVDMEMLKARSELLSLTP